MMRALWLVVCAAACALAPSAGAAVVTGKAPDGTSYRLDGKRLTVRLRAPARVVKVTCGDLAGVTPKKAAAPIWADVTSAAVRRRAARRLAIRLKRNVSARASLCFVTQRGESVTAPPRRRRARMHLQSGTPAGCRPGRYESTLASIGSVDVLAAHRGGFGLRACRSGDKRPTSLFSDVAGRVHFVTGPFALSGDVLGWHVYRETRAGKPLSTVGATNLRTHRSIGTIHPKLRAAAVAVSAAGVLACIQRSSFDDNAAAAILARRLDGRVVTLDSTPGNGLTDLMVTATTVSWLHDGQPRSASI